MIEQHPEVLYVSLVEDGDGELFPLASGSIDDFQDGEVIGIYELKEKKTLEVVCNLT